MIFWGPIRLTHNLLDLSAGVDVYSDWVDACDAVAKESANQYDGATSSQLASSKQGAPALAEADEDDY
jgi:transcription elongation factor Elf1